ncbi:MAG: TIGR02281 family clan AA aspartic protease [Ectothiorhodospiraceae bacterium]|nr:TIGR02281 family clan AA aspartic protease [Ectothiorhodospiraceae bacterium]
MYLARIVVLCLLCVAAASSKAGGVPSIHVQGLFPGQVVALVYGQHTVLRAGASTPGGLRLISADSAVAVFEYKGQRLEHGLSSRAGGTYADRARREVRLYPDSRGMYRGEGAINGIPVHFLVDTGANVIALSSRLADQLGLDYRHASQVQVDTAAGVTTGYRYTLDRVSLGGIEQRGLQAVIVQGGSPSVPLLGMSFLGQLDIRNQDRLLILEARQ